MKFFIILFTLLFVVFFEPFTSGYSHEEILFISAVFFTLLPIFLVSKKSHYSELNFSFFIFIYAFYFVVSNKYDLLTHLHEIRVYLISKQLLTNSNRSLWGTLIAYYQQLIVVYAVALFLRYGKYRNVGLIIIIFEILTSGTRSYGVYIIVPILLKYILKYRWRFKHYFLASLIISMAFLLSEMYAFIRAGSEINRIEMQSSAVSYSKETIMAFRSDVGMVSFEDPFLYMLGSVVPRAIWREKPMSSIVNWYTLKIWGFSSNTNQGTVLPGLVGQLYLGGGWIVILELLCFVLLCRFLLLICNHDITVNVCLICGFILSLRMITLSNFMPFFISVFLYLWNRSKQKLLFSE